MTAEHRIRRSPLTIRLTAAFVLVAVAAVIALAALTLWRTKHTVGRLADERQQATADSIAATLALGYRQAGGWDGVDVHPAVMIALQADATVTVIDPAGNEVTLHNSMPAMPAMNTTAATHGGGPVVTADVVVDGTTVGATKVTFATSELASAERHVRDALSGTVLLGALTAAAVAASVAVPLSRRIIRPLQTVTQTARLVGDGDPTARVGHHDAPGELGDLARAFDDMADRIEATDTARRNVVTDLAHELRTPLTILQGSCEEIIDGIAAPTLERFVEMHDDILRLRRLVDDLNTLADADAAAADQELSRHPCDLADIARAVASELDGVIANHRHLLHLDLAPAVTRGDAIRLRQVITNLLTNAIKYTPDGGHVEVTTSTDADRGCVTLRVSDDGPGIEPHDQPHLFERFYRSATHRSIAGSGIGLAVVERIVTAHHGVVRVVPSEKGAEFEVQLPLATSR